MPDRCARGRPRGRVLVNQPVQQIGLFVPNPQGRYVINSVMGQGNDDDSMTVHLGGCDDDRLNCLLIMDGWNYIVRLYLPGPEILDGSWTFPDLVPVE